MPTVALILSLLLAAPAPPSAPSVPYFHWNGCPFECCQYGGWVAQQTTPVLQQRRTSSRVAFRLRPGEKVIADTGVVVTRKPGIVRFLEDVRFDTSPFKRFLKGEIVHVLHHEGAAFDFVWSKGEASSEEIYAGDLTPSGAKVAWRVESLPEIDWWVRLRNSKGQVGWIKDPSGFAGMSSCD